MTGKTEAEKQRAGLGLRYPHTILIRRRDQAHLLALCRQTALSEEVILRLALCQGLERRAKNAVTQAAINALDQLLHWEEDAAPHETEESPCTPLEISPPEEQPR